MPLAAFRTFVDPSEYQDAVHSAQVQILTTASGTYRAQLTYAELDRFSIQRGYEGLARVSHGLMSPGRGSTYFIRRSEGLSRSCGHEVSSGELLIRGPGSTYHHISPSGYDWGDIRLTPDDLARTGRALVGRDLTFPAGPVIVRPRPFLMSRLMSVHDAAANLAQTSPDVLACPEVARSFEQVLARALVSCLVDEDADQSCDANPSYRLVMTRFEELLAAKANEPLHLPEICGALGTPERTLRSVCQVYLGMGPIRYLWLRRMHLAHATLLKAHPAHSTVATVATQFGFWELGKFSVAYRRLFGERPSETLRRQPDEIGTLATPFALPFAVWA